MFNVLYKQTVEKFDLNICPSYGILNLLSKIFLNNYLLNNYLGYEELSPLSRRSVWSFLSKGWGDNTNQAFIIPCIHILWIAKLLYELWYI